MTAPLWDNDFRRNGDIVSRKIAGEIFLVPVKGNMADMQRIFALNPVAEFIWQNLDKKKIIDICNDVANNFDVSQQEAEEDIQEFINELLEADLIRIE